VPVTAQEEEIAAPGPAGGAGREPLLRVEGSASTSAPSRLE